MLDLNKNSKKSPRTSTTTIMPSVKHNKPNKILMKFLNNLEIGCNSSQSPE